LVEPAGEGVARVSCGLVAVLLGPDPLLPFCVRPLLLLPLLATPLDVSPPLVEGGSEDTSDTAALPLVQDFNIQAFFNLCT
jgi:hypothetical protein